jgi:acetyltransferase-like isoleucine patch superfamily enzyme
VTAKAYVQAARDLTIGPDCIIAWNTFITDCDWHGQDGVDPIAPTRIGSHVWIAPGASVLKGTQIGDNSIVAAGTVVTGGSFPARSLIAGLPGRVIRSDIGDWHRDMEFGVRH